ncbi:MAG: iron-sulfur cluster assembly scaffold protein [Planctomycetes bacterium]|nr:iron-sulfur cluster assembly scaffold protein [Planctomycetota bacterium]
MAAPAFEDHFRNPRNAGVLEGADGKIEVENPVCGDLLHLYWKLSPERRIARATFQVYGCPAAIAAGSMLTELVIDQDLPALNRLSPEEIAHALGGLSRESFHAAVLASDALQSMLRQLQMNRR